MRTAHLVLCASTLLLTTGVIAAGCIDNTVVAPLEGDAGLPSIDSGLPDAATSDAVAPTDATLDAPADAGVDGSVTINTATVDFGLVSCGTGTASKTYSFTNTSPLAINYSASVPNGSVFAITAGSSGVVTPGATASITVAVSAIPTTSTAGTPIHSTLTLTTNVPDAPTVNVPLTVTPQGGSLVVTPALAGFGQVQLAYAGAPIPLAISNVGNAPVTVTFGAPTEPDGGIDSEFGLVYAGSPAEVTIAAGNALADAGATFAPTTPGAKSVTLAMTTTDPLCASATGIAMSGTGTPAQVAVGPNPLQFGAVPCGGIHGPLQVTLTNTSPNSVAFTDTLGLGDGSPFQIDVTSGSVPGLQADGGPGTAVITVSPYAIPVPASIDAGAFNDTLVVTPTTPFVSPTTITLEESASGAILAVALPDSSSFGTISNQTVSLPFTVTNTGNADAPLDVLVSGVGYDAGITSVPATATADGGVAQGLVSFTPTTNLPDNGSFSVTTTAALCSAPPGSVSITATGAVPVASVPTAPISIGATCGMNTGTTGTATIVNNGNAPLVLSNVQSTSGTFTLQGSIGPIAPTDSGILTIQAVAIPTGTQSGGSSLGDFLTFTTNEPGNPQYSIPVSVLVTGANLIYAANDDGGAASSLEITSEDCGSVTYTVQNTGNMAATVVAGGTYPTDNDSVGDSDAFEFGGAFSATAAASLAPNGSVQDTVQQGSGECQLAQPCAPTVTQPFAVSTTLSNPKIAPTGGICMPLPPLTVTVSSGACGTCC